jgi:CRISPR-associated protein Csb2
MIALGIRYLTKYAVATNLARQRPEWPPHPGRVFMAMTAAHFEAESDPAERVALEWLEAASSPAMRASDAYDRTSVRAYVPVNDGHGGILGRIRQDRTFPRTRPHDDCVYLIWEESPAPDIRDALESLCRKVTRVGHSSSAVQMWVVAEGQEPEPEWLPGAHAQDVRLRVPRAGTLRSLESAFNGAAIQEYDAMAEAVTAARGREKTRLKNELQSKFSGGRPESRRPQLVAWQGYGRRSAVRDEQPVLDGPFDENFIVLTKTEGSALGLESTLQLTRALRNQAMKPHGKACPEWLSGHDGASAPTQHPHVAFFPLPYVGSDYADGHILGLGMAIPRHFRHAPGAAPEEELRRVLGPLFFNAETGEEREIKIWNAGVWEWTLEREKRERPPLALQRLSWTKPSQVWASVTPLVLHHYPKKRNGDLERIVKEAFVSAFFPEPEFVGTRSVSAVPGAGHAMAAPLFVEGGADLCRYQTHIVARFAQPARGPMLVGRGRFRGYGLFRPVTDAEARKWTS